MPRFAVNGSATNGTNKTIIGLNQPSSSSKNRAKLVYAEWGSSATADAACECLIQRYTAAGTSTGVTPKPIDFADSAAVLVAGKAHSVEPTYTAAEVMLNMSAHQRAGFVWYAPPGGEIVIPNTASYGLGLYTVSASAAFVQQACFHYDE